MILYDAARRLCAADPEAFDCVVQTLTDATTLPIDDATVRDFYAHRLGRVMGNLDMIRLAGELLRNRPAMAPAARMERALDRLGPVEEPAHV